MSAKTEQAKPSNKERKSPKQGRSQRMVDAIMTAAARVLSVRDLDEISTNLIAEAAGASIGSVYQYFPNKESMAISLMEKFIGDDESLIELFQGSTDTDIDRVVRYHLDAFFSHTWEHRRLLSVLGRHIFRLKLFDAVVTIRLKIRDRVAKKLVLVMGVSEKESLDIAWSIVASVAGFLEAIAFSEMEREEAERLKNKMADMLSAYLKSIKVQAN